MNLNREQRRALKNNRPRNNGIIYQNKMNIQQVQLFLEPLDSFVDQIEQDSVYFDDKGNPLMDLPNNRVEDMARKGIEPRRAADNIFSILETYFQVTALCCSNDDLIRVSEQIALFQRKIINALRAGTPIQVSAISEAREACQGLRHLLLNAPAYQVQRVADNIRSVITAANDRGDKKVTIEELRKWLLNEVTLKEDAA